MGRNLAGELEVLLPAGGGARKISGDPDPDPKSRSYAEPEMADPHLCYEGHNIGVDRRFSVNIIAPKIAAPHL